MSKVRVRFAPSPTGYVHVGNARTALFNWLFARHHGGAFVLRIEDTDAERSKPEYERQLLQDLRWFGLDWDEGPDKGGSFGPYRQSERGAIYTQYAEKLIGQGDAYYCFCSAEQLEAERQEELKAGRQPRYSGRCRKLAAEEVSRRKTAGEPAAVRLKIVESSFFWNDRVHGPTTFSSEVIGDPVIVRSEGLAAYNYAVVIDDHLMEITHVIRGDDHISNTPRQLALYRALGWEPPEFAHLSTILGPDHTRLSKRHGATSMSNFREEGILPEALRNYLLLLGWSASDGKTEKFNTDEMIAQFSLDRITKSPAVFDRKKLDWLNGEYLFALPTDQRVEYFTKMVTGVLTRERYLAEDEVARAKGLIDQILLVIIESKIGVVESKSESKDKASLLDLARLIFEYDGARVVRNESTRLVLEDPLAREILVEFVRQVVAEPTLSFGRFQELIKSLGKKTGTKGRQLYHPVRIALTGEESGPELKKMIPIFEDGAQLLLKRPVKSCAERLREFAEAAKLEG
ncbi:MAG: glutamate--tRNA ligase [Terriglobia bacterium]|jgi:glutamyl-tRNA synthetase/nondiscriminating glutamyl-tRNA synthetase